MSDPASLTSLGGFSTSDLEEDEEDERGGDLNQRQEWIQAQDLLKGKLLLRDDFDWTVPAEPPSSSSPSEAGLRFVGGVDVSYSKADPSVACGALAVVDLCSRDLDVVYEACSGAVRLRVPYVPGFLAFREAPILVKLLEDMKRIDHPFYPQLLMVDGNGLLHPRGFGLACHLGVLMDIPTIGVGKNLHHVDGLTKAGVRRMLEDRTTDAKDQLTLRGKSGQVWGVAMRLSSCNKPIFVSAGHRISLDSCVKVVKFCCKFRVPEPIRQEEHTITQRPSK